MYSSCAYPKPSNPFPPPSKDDSIVVISSPEYFPIDDNTNPPASTISAPGLEEEEVYDEANTTTASTGSGTSTPRTVRTAQRFDPNCTETLLLNFNTDRYTAASMEEVYNQFIEGEPVNIYEMDWN